MTDTEIIKALKELLETALYNGDLQSTETISKALDLINRQNAEIERLREINSLLTEAGQEWQKRYKTAKAEAIKEFAERLKMNDFFNSTTKKIVIDNLVEEMIGEQE